MRVHAAGSPFGHFFQSPAVPHTDQPLAVGQIGFGRVEMAAVTAGNDMAIEAAVGLYPMPLFRLGAARRGQAHQPVTRAAAGKHQTAVAQAAHAMCP
ncbi:hypothetical protein D3C71_1739800 [compost metagenome]